MARYFIVGCGALHASERCPGACLARSEASISCRMVRYTLKFYSFETLESMARARGLSESDVYLKRTSPL